MQKSDSFEDLICWQKAYNLKRRLKREVLPKLPRTEKYELYSQIFRAFAAVRVTTHGHLAVQDLQSRTSYHRICNPQKNSTNIKSFSSCWY
ncbi:four helix bundle protein [Algoriphagus kandeliae]|uniref:Four helix bundle protein n=1 Tax=Algoriphagus kandeliae TaxID=2562278 RepID=A0A4Y9QXS7_9BACT|nr:four helix bundle protein [Algoriphagus kandeliae]TFV97271.1 four helix bundle protein [Algoriphagus kandeliae]